MKKLLALITTIALVLAMGTSCFAASSYNKSPAVQETPTITDIDITTDPGVEIEIVDKKDDEITFHTITGDPVMDDCLVTLKVTPYAEKQTIDDVVCKVTDGTSPTGEVSAEERLIYARTNTKNGTDGFVNDNFALWRDIISKAAQTNQQGAKEANSKIQNKDMAIVTIFDVSVWCEKPEIHDITKHHCVHNIKLTFGDDEMSSLLENYVALMHYDRTGSWVYIPSKLYEDPATHEDVIEFSIDCENLSPFAIAAFSDKGNGPISPQTGYDMTPLAISAISALALAAFAIRKRER